MDVKRDHNHIRDLQTGEHQDIFRQQQIIFMTYRQQREPAKSIHIWKKASQEELVVSVAIELERMQKCEGLFQTEALKAGSEIIQGWRPFLLLLTLIPCVSPRYFNSHVTYFTDVISLHTSLFSVTADPLWTEVWLWKHVNTAPVGIFWWNVPNKCCNGPRDDDARLTDGTMAAS